MNAFLASLALVVMAEMGDKTQLLAMTFAARISWKTVLGGVLLATLGNHLLAVIAGNYLDTFLPLSYVKIAAAASFIGFGFWSLRGDTLTVQEHKVRYRPLWTVTIAFFLAEMGDKTQLVTIALAAEFNTVIPVWFGTTSGMIIADIIGIWVGVVLGKKLPEQLVRKAAAMIFIGFGLLALYEAFNA